MQETLFAHVEITHHFSRIMKLADMLTCWCRCSHIVFAELSFELSLECQKLLHLSCNRLLGLFVSLKLPYNSTLCVNLRRKLHLRHLNRRNEAGIGITSRGSLTEWTKKRKNVSVLFCWSDLKRLKNNCQEFGRSSSRPPIFTSIIIIFPYTRRNRSKLCFQSYIFNQSRLVVAGPFGKQLQ